MREVSKAIIHCTATPEGREVSVDTIRQWHLDRGWSDIGYHYIIALNGRIDIGRPIEQTGAHTSGHNTGSVGISYVGGVDAEMNAKDTRTREQKASLYQLLSTLKLMFPALEVYGHRDFTDSKECPSFDARSEYSCI